MNIIKKIIYIICAVSFSVSLTGCLDDAQLTTGATEEQLGSSAKATEALLWAMPAFTNNFNTLSRRTDDEFHWDFGYPAIMTIRDIMGEDHTVLDHDYNQWTYWLLNQHMGKEYVFSTFVWRWHYKFILTTNKVIGAVEEETATPTQKFYLGAAYAMRAFGYLDAAQMYEFLPNDMVSSVNAEGHDVTGLTIPIVTESTTEEEARNNPRVPHEEMVKFIENDLNKAEELITNGTRPHKSIPNIDVIYGLKARLYLWDEQYDKAKTYARKVIDSGFYTPMSNAEWNDPTTGFNTLSTKSWMWGSETVKEDDAVQTGICNFVSMLSPETVYGYAGHGPVHMISKSTYDKISDQDFRKYSFKAPEGSAIADKTIYINPTAAENYPAYTSVKFRPGSGNVEDYQVGSVAAYPMMRVEEMYFIEAEAAAHQNAAEGKKLLEDFMKTWRYKGYVCRSSAEEDVIQEIILQKRIEFWGEGIVFFDYKRLNMPVTRRYEGSNHLKNSLFNTTTRPAWMNFVIPIGEEENNEGIRSFNNPDPSGVYESE